MPATWYARSFTNVDGHSEREKKEEKQERKSLSHFARLDTLVTVVDAVNIYEVLSSIETLADENNKTGMAGNKAPEGEEGFVDDRSIVQLFLDQIEFANVIILSKAQLVTGPDKGSEKHEEGLKRIQEIETLLRKLNPNARVVVPMKDKYADLDTEKYVVNTALFDMEKASASEAWVKELEAVHVPETEEYGISSLIFRANHMPFHPQRLKQLLKGFGNYRSAADAAAGGNGGDAVFQGVFRSKGYLWLANANSYRVKIHSAGRSLNLQAAEMSFLAAVKTKNWTAEERAWKERMEQEGKWNAEYGDRASMLVFIGVNLNKSLMEKKLSEALLTDEESASLGGVEGWRGLEDPFFGGAAAEEFFELSEAPSWWNPRVRVEISLEEDEDAKPDET